MLSNGGSLKKVLFTLLCLGSLFMSQVEANETVAKSVTASTLGPVKVGETFPTFGGHTVGNDYVSLRSLIGQEKTIVVSYFATWCGPCRVGLPQIEKFAQDNSNVEAIYIALGEKSSAPVQKFASELNLKSPIIMDKFESIGMRHGVVVEGQETKLPRTFILNPDGTVKTIVTVEGEDFFTVLENQIK